MIGKIDKCWDLLGCSRLVMNYNSTPETSALKGSIVKFSHDTEIVRATLESSE